MFTVCVCCFKEASGSLPGSSGSVQPRTRPRARGLRGSAEGRPCRSVFPSAVRNFRTFRPEAFDAVLRPQNLTGEVSAGVWRGRRPSRSDLPSRGVDGRRAYLVTSGSRAKPGTIARGRIAFRWSVRGRRMVSCTRPLAASAGAHPIESRIAGRRVRKPPLLQERPGRSADWSLVRRRCDRARIGRSVRRKWTRET